MLFTQSHSIYQEGTKRQWYTRKVCKNTGQCNKNRMQRQQTCVRSVHRNIYLFYHLQYTHPDIMKRATHSYTLILYQGGYTVLTLLLYYARKLIVLSWKKPTTPDAPAWKALINKALSFYKAMYVNRGIPNTFEKVWGRWIVSLQYLTK